MAAVSGQIMGPGVLINARWYDALLADKGYDADAIGADLAKRTIEPAIPGRSIRRVKIAHDRAVQDQPRHRPAIRPTGEQRPRNGPSCHLQILTQICPRRPAPCK